MNHIKLNIPEDHTQVSSFYWDSADLDFGPKTPSRYTIECNRRHRPLAIKQRNSFRLDPRTGARPEKAVQVGCSSIFITSKFKTMALNQPDRIDVVKAAANNDKLKDIKFSESLGSVHIGGDKYTDRAAAVKKLNEKK